MLKVRQVKIDVLKDTEEERKKAICNKLKIDIKDFLSLEISKQSIDARDKNNIFYVYEFIISIKNEDRFLNKTNDIVKYNEEKYVFPLKGEKKLNNRPIIVGSGPAGLFAAFTLAENGYKPLIIERGEMVDKRVESVNCFWQTGKLNPNSNVQFGEGGAGTFSDGKLNTLIKDTGNRWQKVFETFIKCGAPKEIMYSYKPHIGTDILINVIKNMRDEIIKMGGSFLYETCLTNLVIEDNKLKFIEVNNKDIIPCDALILTIGHSARDTFKMLYDNKIEMAAKPFAVGFRIQHSQKMIDESQYGQKYANILNKASYKLTYQSKNNRGIYSFCMCPGGFVVNASSEEGMLAVNGMSNHERNTENANSAIVITITPKDFGNHPLDGIKYQRSLEKKAYQKGNGNIPIQLLGDFKQNRNSIKFGNINPVFKGNYNLANLRCFFTDEINNDLIEAINYFGKKIKNFDTNDAILAAIESRTSSPVRIIRNEEMESNIAGIYPCGEGAGYAGGITSAAIDGIKVAEAIGKKYFYTQKK